VPIRASEKARYPADWKAISLRIRERENQRCKWCGAPNGKQILRDRNSQRWRLFEQSAPWCDEDGVVPDREAPKPFDQIGPVKVVLTVAHLDHTPENCADDNLAALCQRCHNRYDLPMRREGRKARLGIIGLDFRAAGGE
jgi:hypothetical protein